MGNTLPTIDAAIPHRAPFVLVDRVISVEGNTVTAEKRVTSGDPLVGERLAGPLLIEALAQTAASLMGVRSGGQEGHRGYLVAAQGWKFPSFAQAGETVTLRATKTAELGGMHRFVADARVGDRELCTGTMTFAVSFGAP